MVKGKKAFIDRKNAVTFHLVHRSQHDPLITDETAPQHVLVEAVGQNVVADPAKRIEEQKKFGVFYDDDYNYLQHLKKPGQVVWECVETPNQHKHKNDRPKIQLPSSVFQSQFEEDEGMLNKAAPTPGPRPDWDPDIVAALDEDFNFENPENALEDDFVSKAMEETDDFDEYEEYDDEDVSSNGLMSDEENEDEIADRLGPLMRDQRFSNDEETKSRFTEYSMSSSVIRRNEQLTLLDDRFEEFYKTYEDQELGPLDMENIEGSVGQKHPLIKQCLSEIKKSKELGEYKKVWDQDRLENFRKIHDSDDEELVELEIDDSKKWDCESILSTYSNIYNHPKLIEEPKRFKIKIDPKTGIPMNVLNGSDKLTAKALARLDNEFEQKVVGPKSLCDKSVLSTLSVLSIRPKDETLEEKRERKRLLREYRMERRMERKANSEAFKEEKKKQIKIKINNQNNIQGNKIL